MDNIRPGRRRRCSKGGAPLILFRRLASYFLGSKLNEMFWKMRQMTIVSVVLFNITECTNTTESFYGDKKAELAQMQACSTI